MTTIELEWIAPGELTGRRLKATGTEATLGRAEDCALRIDDPRVSRRHARLWFEDESLLVEDLGSPNGTVVNGVRVARQQLSVGDVLAFGKHRLRVVGQGPRIAPSPPSKLVKPVSSRTLPAIDAGGKEAFFKALGLGDETLLEVGPGAAAALLAKTRHFAVLHQLSQELQSALDPQQMLGLLLELVLEVTGADRGFVVLSDPPPSPGDEDDTLPPPGEGGGLRVEVVRGKQAGAAPPQLSRTVAQHVLEERCAVLSHDPTDDERFAGSQSLFLSQTRALLAAPILLRDEVLGALVVESDRSDVFSEPDLDLLGVLAPMAGQTLDNLRLAARREATIRELEATQARLLSTREQLVRSEQLAAIGRLSSGLAHEVKNHLSPFMLAQLIARKYPDDEEIQSSVEMMLEARQHIVDLVSEVKGFARGADAGPVVRQATDLVQLSRAVVRFAACDVAVKRHALSVSPGNEPWAEVEVPRIRQLLVNLIKNAADALGETAGGRIEVRLEERETWALVDVVDNGPGIPPEVAERIFEPFYSTKGEQGLGLGLDISRKIARSHGGELSFSTEPGVGTTFRLRLPALPE